MRFAAGRLTLSLCATSLLSSGQLRAADGAAPDRFELWARGETNAALFRRALLPGARGAIVSTDTVAPLRHDVRLRAVDIDTSWAADAVDVELSAWAVSTLGEPGLERPIQGDVQTANVGYRHGPLRLRLGRQHAAGGAARYVRFDGADAGVELGAGFDVGAYGGFVALPQWNQQPGYFSLGSAAEALVLDPGLLGAADRSDNFTVGGHLGWQGHRTSVQLSMHEQQQDDGLARRNAGAIVRTQPAEAVAVGGNALVELDSGSLADGRLWVDTTPLEEVTATVEYLHTEPALLLSRQSVVAVFSTSAYDEVGGFVDARPFGRRFVATGAGYLQVYDGGHPGARGEVGARLAADRAMKTLARIVYGRTLAPDNGYHSIRASVSRRLTERLASTLEAYAYFYDAAIRSVDTSSVLVGTVTWRAVRRLDVLFGASVARSPYAELDAQAQMRLSYDFDLRGGRLQ